MCAASLATFITIPTHASVISDLSELDWQDAGGTLLTHDASIGLDWLDLTVTAGNFILDTEGAVLFCS